MILGNIIQNTPPFIINAVSDYITFGSDETGGEMIFNAGQPIFEYIQDNVKKYSLVLPDEVLLTTDCNILIPQESVSGIGTVFTYIIPLRYTTGDRNYYLFYWVDNNSKSKAMNVEVIGASFSIELNSNYQGLLNLTTTYIQPNEPTLPDWIHIGSITQVDDYKCNITISVDENTGEARNEIITFIQPDSNKEVTLTIAQAGV